MNVLHSTLYMIDLWAKSNTVCFVAVAVAVVVLGMRKSNLLAMNWAKQKWNIRRRKGK